jgi:RND family efflux transporter MFP subunit
MKTTITIGLVLMLASACKNEKESQQNDDALVLPVVKLLPRDTVLKQDYVASIQACRNVELRAKVSGYINRILVDEGQRVKKGQLLFVLEAAEYTTALTEARAALANAVAEARTAELELKRVDILVKKNVISKTEYELGEARLKAAQARINEFRSKEDNAKVKLSYTQIRAPFDGVIDRIPFKLGSLVDEGSLLTTVSDLSSMYVYFNFSENEYLHFIRSKKNAGDLSSEAVSLLLADGTEFPYHGRIETMVSEFDQATGSIAFRAKFPNPDQLLKHGASGKIHLKSYVSEALIIPQKAVVEVQDKSFVYVMEKDSTVTMKSFEPQRKINEYIIVKAGLSPRDTIVYEGIQNINEGSQIIPQFITLDKIAGVVSTPE